MNKRFFAFLAVLLLSLCICGCQLAKPDGDVPAEPDRLVGLFVTTEYLDLFDYDRYLQDNLDNLIDGNLSFEDSAEYESKLFAEYIEESFQDNEGNTHIDRKYRFPDLEGSTLAIYRILHAEEDYHATDVGGYFSQVHSRSGGSDEGIRGTIWVAPNSGDVIFYMNPMYQTADGQVYLIPGSGIHMSGDLAGQSTQTLSETYTVTENGQTEEYTFEAEVIIDFATPAETVTVLQMDSRNTLISQKTYPVDQLPDLITPSSEAAYLIVQTESKTGTQRQLIQREDNKITIFTLLNTQICTQKSIPVEW